MAEAKNNFIKSKMNKDLDDRLVPAGEYRHAQNIAVAKSEGQDVGALENILGNNLISNFLTTLDRPIDMPNVEIIGHFMDVKNDRIIVFMTNYTDTSNDALSNFSPTGAEHYIGVYDVLNSVSSIVVSGRFLNFSKTHEIYGVNMIDDLLFWTDNRNQPRKINIASALADDSYYTTEDTISVSKYYPHKTIDLVAERVTSAVFWPPVSTIYSSLIPDLPVMNLPCHNSSGSGNGSGLTVDVTAVDGTGQVTAFNINNPGFGYQNGDIVVIGLSPGGGTYSMSIAGGAYLQLRTEVQSTMQDVVSDFLPDGTTTNPYRQPYVSNPVGPFGDISWRGNPEYLKDKFVRFSYRFKFDDGEYSLIAPFTQTCFVPKQDGYFLENDDTKSYKSTEVDIMQNKINDILLIIKSPKENLGYPGFWKHMPNDMKITEIDILYKESGQNTIKVVDTIAQDQLSLIESTYLTYSYASTKPWKTLPDKEILRVHDQVPVRALSQELVGNRIVYGNYIDKPTPPTSISYSLSVDEKEVNTQIEYQNQNLKQNRTYQVGIVLSDRYGRQSSTVLSSIDDSQFAQLMKGSTIFHDYKKDPFSTYPTGGLYGPNPVTGDDDVWDGDALELQFWDTISSTKNSGTGEPGLYDEITNPLGWYTYKIVVKQEEQDYYNIYFPGILNGYIDGEALSTQASEEEPICHFVLAGDNINKVPRDLSLIGPNQTIFRTGRPSAQEDPSYYQFVDSSGLDFTVDPFSKEGERLLKERDRKRDLDSGSQITNASVKLSLRLNNAVPDPTGGVPLLATDTTTHQAYPGTNLDVVTTIGTGSELGLWDPSAIIPFNTANVFYGYKNNPYVAKVNVSAPVTTGIKGPHPQSGVFTFKVASTSNGSVPGSYIAESKNVPCTIPASSGYTISGFKVDIPTSPLGPGNDSLIVADIGIGWPSIFPSAGIVIPGCTISGAGSGDSNFQITVTNDTSDGLMAPSLAVYETQPLKSKLDIYWETSTNGLIDELNTAIIEGDTTTPVGFMGYTQPDIAWDHKENMDIGTDITPSAIIPKAPDGSAINGPNYATLLSAIDGDNVSRTSEFTIVNHSNQSFSIETNSYFMCDVDNNTKGEFTFNINIQVPGPTFPIDGLYIDANLPLGPYTLENMPPEFDLTSPGVQAANLDAIWAGQGFGSNEEVLNFRSADWNSATPPFNTGSLNLFNSSIFDSNGSFNSTNGVYTCTKAGNYDIAVEVLISGDFQVSTNPTWTYSGGTSSLGATPCGSIFGNIYLQKNSSVAVDTQQVVMSAPDMHIYQNGWALTNTNSPLIVHSDYGNFQGGAKGWGWPSYKSSGPSGVGLQSYRLSVSNYYLNVGDNLRVKYDGMFVGGSPDGQRAYGRGFCNSNDNWYYSGGYAKMVLVGNGFGVTSSTLEYDHSSSGYITSFVFTNGSYNAAANSLKDDSISFTLDDTYAAPGLFYGNDIGNGEFKLYKNPGGEAGDIFLLTITATDCAGGGLSTDLDFIVILT